MRLDPRRLQRRILRHNPRPPITDWLPRDRPLRSLSRGLRRPGAGYGWQAALRLPCPRGPLSTSAFGLRPSDFGPPSRGLRRPGAGCGWRAAPRLHRRLPPNPAKQSKHGGCQNPIKGSRPPVAGLWQTKFPMAPQSHSLVRATQPGALLAEGPSGLGDTNSCRTTASPIIRAASHSGIRSVLIVMW